jgi:hypothetical protein
MTLLTKLIRSAAMLLAATAIIAAPPAAAQLGGIVNQAKKRAEREARDAAETAVAKAIFPLEQDSANLRRMSVYMDRYTPRAYNDIGALERTASGGFALAPGTYRFESQSYCLKPGAYGRPGGAGYMSGELTGKLAPYLRDILANSYRRPDINRDHIQSLIWGLIGGVKISSMNADSRAAAAALLSPQQILALSGPDAFIPPQLSSRAMRKLPRSARNAYDAHQRLRLAAERPDVSFAELERIAIREGEAPTTDNDVPAGRWSWRPDGFFIRYSSNGYRRTTAEIVVPEAAEIIRDSIGRISDLRFGNGDSVITTYADDTPISKRKYRGVVSFPIARVEIRSTDPVTGAMRVAVADQGGHMFFNSNSIRGAALHTRQFSHAGFTPILTMFMPTPIRVIDIGAINEANARRKYYEERARRLSEPPSRADIDDITDLGHYSDGIETAFGSPSDRYEWLIDHFERQNRALAYATSLIESLGEGGEEAAPSTGLPVWEPSAESALPARDGYAQRLGLSGRSW